MNGRELGAALRSGKRVYGTCVTNPAPHWTGIAAALKLDFVFIDTEHTPLNRETVAWTCQSFASQHIAPIVRIPEPDPYQACAILDGGAAGIVAPYVETVEQVQALRGAIKLRPLQGERLASVLAGTETLEPELAAYIAARNANNLLIINVESKPALDRLDDLLAVPGLDAVLVGPHDLSCSLGVAEQYGHPRFLEAASTIIRKCRAANVGVGLHYSEDTVQPLAWAREGANFMVHSSDMRAVRDALGEQLGALRTALGD